MKDIWEPASYIALRLIVSLRILCNALYGHPFSEYCSYEKNIFLKYFLKTTFEIWLFYARKNNLRIFGLKLTELNFFQNQEMQKIMIGGVYT